MPILHSTPKGDGHGVFVIPGLGGSERSTALLRHFITSKGYTCVDWGMGRNLGIKRSGGANQLIEKFLEFQQQVGGKVSIVGWSLGGVHARRIARQCEDQVRQVICLGSPINGSPTDTVEWQVDAANTEPNFENVQQQQFQPIAVPCTAIFSKSDGIVPWKYSLETNAEPMDNIEVTASHLGLGANPSVFYIIANRLAQSEDDWKPFDTKHWRNRLALAMLDPLGQVVKMVAS